MCPNYETTLTMLRNQPPWNNRVMRTDQDCVRRELISLLKRQENTGRTVGCINLRNLPKIKLADAWTDRFRGKISFDEIATETITELARIRDDRLQMKVLVLLKAVIKSDTDPFTFKQLGRFCVPHRLMKKIIMFCNGWERPAMIPLDRLLAQYKDDLAYLDTTAIPISTMQTELVGEQA